MKARRGGESEFQSLPVSGITKPVARFTYRRGMDLSTFPTPPLTHPAPVPPAGRLGAEQQIRNLLFRYAELIDGARFDECGRLFERAEFLMGEHRVGPEQMVAHWKSLVIVHPDGTLATSHITSNLLVEFGPDGTTATCRSRFTVLQATDTLPLQPICSGRYHDTFAVSESGEWYFTSRSYSMPLVGNTTEHMRTSS